MEEAVSLSSPSPIRWERAGVRVRSGFASCLNSATSIGASGMKIFTTLLFCACVVARADEPKLADFQKFAEEQLKLWHAPGASIAIVRSNEVLLGSGFGLRDL